MVCACELRMPGQGYTEPIALISSPQTPYRIVVADGPTSQLSNVSWQINMFAFTVFL